MDRQTAMEWAGRIGSYRALAESGERTLAHADEIVGAMAEALAREAEAGGWLREWDAALARGEDPAPAGLDFGQRMHALANPGCRAKTMSEALPYFMDVVERLAATGLDRVSFDSWAGPVDGPDPSEVPKLKRRHAIELADLLERQGLSASCFPAGRLDLYRVNVEW